MMKTNFLTVSAHVHWVQLYDDAKNMLLLLFFFPTVLQSVILVSMTPPFLSFSRTKGAKLDVKTKEAAGKLRASHTDVSPTNTHWLLFVAGLLIFYFVVLLMRLSTTRKHQTHKVKPVPVSADVESSHY